MQQCIQQRLGSKKKKKKIRSEERKVEAEVSFVQLDGRRFRVRLGRSFVRTYRNSAEHRQRYTNTYKQTIACTWRLNDHRLETEIPWQHGESLVPCKAESSLLMSTSRRCSPRDPNATRKRSCFRRKSRTRVNVDQLTNELEVDFVSSIVWVEA